MLLEERDDVLRQVLMSAHTVGHPISVVPSNNATTEICLQCLQDLNVAFVLDDGEFRQNLESGGHFRVGIDPHMKTTFAIHEPDYPLRIELQRALPNVKSLRIPDSSPGLSCGLSPCPSDFYGRRLPGLRSAASPYG